MNRILRCNVCRVEKQKEQFAYISKKVGGTCLCKECKLARQRKYRQRAMQNKAYRDRFNKMARERYKKYRENPDFVERKRSQSLKSLNKKMATADGRKHLAEYNKNYQKRYYVEKIKPDRFLKFKVETKRYMNKLVRAGNKLYNKTAVAIIGCDYDFLKKHLESTWERNYGKPYNGEPYQIDHIIPISIAKTKDEVLRLCHYTNLQMLTPADNCKKGFKTAP